MAPKKDEAKTTTQPAATSTEIAKVNSTTALMQTSGIDLAADSVEHEQVFEKDDFAIPFLRLMQTNTPQAVEGDAEYIEGSKPGHALVTSTREFIDTLKGSCIFVPVTYRHTFIEWVTRDAGGGFVKDHGLAAGTQILRKCEKDEKGRQIIPGTDGKNQLVETMQYFVLYWSPKAKAFLPAMFVLTSTQLKKGRLLNSMVDGLRVEVGEGENKREIKPPMFYQAYSFSAVREENEQGKWFGYKIESHAPLPELPGGVEAYNLAKKFREQVSAGDIDMTKAAEAEAKADGGGSSSSDATNAF